MKRTALAGAAGRRLVVACLVGAFWTGSGPAEAKFLGNALPDPEPPAMPALPPPPVLPSRPAPLPRVAPSRVPAFAAPPVGAGERDPEARAEAAQLPLDPATANLQGRLPTDVPGTLRQLNLRVPNGSRMDLRGRSISTPEVINALQH